MTVTNDFLTFAEGGGANVETQSAYAADALRPIGNQPGIAISAFNNKAIRQANAVTSQLAQLIANSTQTNVTDDATPTKLLAQITSVMTHISPIFGNYTSGSGTFNLSYVFFIASGNATAGATYTNNSITYTVSATISSGLTLVASGNGSPTTSGTLTKASGTGDSTITFYAIRAPIYMRVRAMGGGGGGAGSGVGGGVNIGGTGGNGGATTFGSGLLSAGGGSGGSGAAGVPGGAGGTNGSLTGVSGYEWAGGHGGGNTQTNTASAYALGGNGGTGAFGGSGGTGGASDGGSSGSANTGGGGGGAGGTSTSSECDSGSGGGSGGFIDAIIYNTSVAWASSYAFSVGGGGTSGTAGASGYPGGAGGSGYLDIILYFQ